MPTLAEIMGGIDSYVTPAKRRLVDLLRNPADYTAQAFGQVGDNVAAFNKNAVTAQEGQQLGLLGSVMGGAPQYQQAQSKVLQGLMGIAPIGATVWHGSPHKFDKFDASKIGTGEGAQAQGVGHYMAGSQDLAKQFQADRSYVGKAMQGTPDTAPWDAQRIAKDALDIHGDDAPAYLAKVLKQRSSMKAPGQAEENKLVQDAISLLQSGQMKGNGYLYKIDLPDEQIAKMLEFNTPINQHPAAVLDALEKAGINTQSSALAGPMVMGQERYLAKRGIPGLKYSEHGSSSNNYVVFPGNEGLLNILERNGKPVK